jgi:hypothetical protein
MDLWGPAPSFAFPRAKLRGRFGFIVVLLCFA